MKDCRVISEDPPDVHFGEEALRVAPKLKVKPFTRDGQPIEGTLTIPMRFVVGDDGKPALPAAASQPPSR